MPISMSTVSLNVSDPQASGAFLAEHFDFEVVMSLPEICSVRQTDATFSVAFLPVGLASFKPADQAGPAGGLLVAFTVADVDAEYARLTDAGVPIVTPIETEPWQERYFQVRDPSGLVVQVVGWVTEDGQPPRW